MHQKNILLCLSSPEEGLAIYGAKEQDEKDVQVFRPLAARRMNIDSIDGLETVEVHRRISP